MRIACILASTMILTSACARSDDIEAVEENAIETATAPPAGGVEPGAHPGMRPSGEEAEMTDPPGLLPKPPPELLTPEKVARPDVPPSLSGTAPIDDDDPEEEPRPPDEGRRGETQCDPELAVCDARPHRVLPRQNDERTIR